MAALLVNISTSVVERCYRKTCEDSRDNSTEWISATVSITCSHRHKSRLYSAECDNTEWHTVHAYVSTFSIRSAHVLHNNIRYTLFLGDINTGIWPSRLRESRMVTGSEQLGPLSDYTERGRPTDTRPQISDSNIPTGSNIWSQVSQGCSIPRHSVSRKVTSNFEMSEWTRDQDILTDWPSVVTWLWHWLGTGPFYSWRLYIQGPVPPGRGRVRIPPP
jgi:hypothetical protein